MKVFFFFFFFFFFFLFFWGGGYCFSDIPHLRSIPTHPSTRMH